MELLSYGHFGSHIDDCAVTGTDDGYTVQSTNEMSRLPRIYRICKSCKNVNCTAGDKTNQKIGPKQVVRWNSWRLCRTNKFRLSCRFEVGFWSSECNILTC